MNTNELNILIVLLLMLIFGMLMADYAYCDSSSNNGMGSINDDVLWHKQPQCPPGDAKHPNQHQKADGTWVNN